MAAILFRPQCTPRQVSTLHNMQHFYNHGFDLHTYVFSFICKHADYASILVTNIDTH